MTFTIESLAVSVNQQIGMMTRNVFVGGILCEIDRALLLWGAEEAIYPSWG